MGRPGTTVIELSERRLRAVRGRWSKGRFALDAVVDRPCPGDLDLEQADAVGRWVRETLASAGLSTRRAVWVIGRRTVVAKRLRLPTTDPGELPEMARLAIVRDLPFEPDGAIIDFVPQETDDEGTTIFAFAAARGAVQTIRSIARAARIGIDRISLRSLGAPALLAASDDAPSRTSVIIDVLDDVIEFAFLVGGTLQHIRAAEIDPSLEGEARAEAVLTEARRTWMSYRMTHGDTDLGEVVLDADAVVGERVRSTLGDLLHAPVRLLAEDAPIDPPPSKRETGDVEFEAASLWPLAGLAVGPLVGHATIDFEHPRRPPDRHARLRQGVLGAAAMLLIAIGFFWTYAKRDFADLDSTIERLERQRSAEGPDYLRESRMVHRLQHLERWEQVRVDWIDHLVRLQSMIPGSERLVLDGWNGSLDFDGVEYDHRAGADERWILDARILLLVEGEAVDRATADAFREQLVVAVPYRTSSTGADRAGGRRLPFGFNYRLSSSDLRLADQPSADQPSEVASDDEADRVATREVSSDGGDL